MGLRKTLKKIIGNLSIKPKVSTENYSNLRIGVAGAGTQGILLSASAEQVGAKIVAVHDRKLVKARKLALLRKAELATADPDEFFKVKMDGLLLCTVPKIRTELIKRACKNNIHLLIEKPPAYNLIEGQECLSAIEKAGVITSVGFQLRYEPRYERLKQLIKGHVIHLVRTVCTVDYYLNFRMPDWFLKNEASGGPIAEQASHLLDIVRFVLGNPRATKATSFGVKNMAIDRMEFDAENSIQLIYELDNGVIGVHTNHCGHERPCFDLELIGPHLRLEANATEKTIHGMINGQKINENIPDTTAPRLNKVTAWLKAINTGERNYLQSDYLESLNTQSLIESAIKSRTTQRVEIIKSVDSLKQTEQSKA